MEEIRPLGIKGEPLNSDGRPTQYADSRWNIESRVSVQSQGYSDEASVCLLGGVHNGDEVTLFHLLPSNSSIDHYDNVEKLLSEDIEKLKENGKPLQALLTGGKLGWPESVAILNRVQAFFERLNIPVSVIGGQQELNVRRSLYTDPKSDTWYVGINRDKPSRFQEREKLLDDFTLIEIAPNDTLEVLEPEPKQGRLFNPFGD